MCQDAFLIIDDQKSITLLLKDQLQKLTSLPILTCHSLAEARELLDSDMNFVVCLSDLHLPDGEPGEAIELLHSRHITTVVLTATYNDKTRQEMFKQKVADYVVKDSPSAIHYAVQTAFRLYQNARRHIWLVTSWKSHFSSKLSGLLRVHRYQVTVFENNNEFLSALREKHPDLVLLEGSEACCDQGSTPYEVVNRVRQSYTQNQLPILACETSANIATAIKLMKYGVNDFFNLEFTAEELYVRVKQNIEQTAAYKEIEHISRTDALTGLFNRGYFFRHGQWLFDQLQNHQKYFFVLMADIDHFKAVNDTHGHQKGDEAIQFVSQQIQDAFNQFLVARFGGEEFCVIGEVSDASEIEAFSETLRHRIEQQSPDALGLPLTLSQGLTYSGQSLDEAIAKADKALYRAKESGRNRVEVEF